MSVVSPLKLNKKFPHLCNEKMLIIKSKGFRKIEKSPWIIATLFILRLINRLFEVIEMLLTLVRASSKTSVSKGFLSIVIERLTNTKDGASKMVRDVALMT